MSLYADVALPLPLDRPYTYSVPPEAAETIGVGSRVLVPLGERWVTGFVVALKKRRPAGRPDLKPVREVMDERPVFSPALLSFARKLGRSCFLSWGEILQAALPPSFLLRSKPDVSLTAEGKEALEKERLSDEERRVATLLVLGPRTPRFLERKSGVPNISSLISRLRKKKLVAVGSRLSRVRERAPAPAPGPVCAQLKLDFSWDEGLEWAAETIRRKLRSEAFSPFLLFGSAARREALYLRLIKDTLAGGGRVLYLIPEISLTAPLLEKIEQKLGEGAALLHSRLPEKKRALEWQKIKEGRADVVVGPRSALFAPLDNLRLIILDEEQDESYSPQEGLPYDVRRAAGLRAAEERAILVCGSDRPLVESFYRALAGGYLVDVGGEANRGSVSVADSRREPGLVCSRLKDSIRQHLEKKSPVILFLNRRGYAAFLVCPGCAFVPRCDRCDMALSYHKREGKLACHACRREAPAASVCPRCGSRLVMKKGAGIEALAEELEKVFPGRRVEVFAADEARLKTTREDLLCSFCQGEIDILLGTQLLARQPGVPPVSLVGILHPEMALHLADFRSAQRAFEAVSRPLRFLRPEGAAEAVIQTAAPDHHAIRAAAQGDFRSFYEKEIQFRRLLGYPPFFCLAEIFFSGKSLRRAAEAARAFAAEVRKAGAEIQIFGPSLAAVAKLRGLHRVQVSLKARRPATLDRVLNQALRGIRSKKGVLLFC